MCRVFQNTAAGAMEALSYASSFSLYGMIAAQRDHELPGVWHIHHVHNGSFGTSIVYLPGYAYQDGEPIDNIIYESEFI